MNFLEKLLDGVAVEWKPLGEVCENISSGRNKNKSDVGIYPVFGSTGIIGRTNNKVYEKEQILVARVGANAGRVNIAQGEYDVSDNTLIIQNKENIVLKYLYYILVNMNINQFAKGAGQPLITARQLKNIQIPIPSLEEQENPEKSLAIQAEIVRILDTFTALTAELTAELTDRKKQYNYYRDRLLTFEKGEVEWKPLGDVSLKSYSGGTPTAGTSEYYDGGTIPWLRTQEVKFSDIEKTEVKITPSALKNSAVKWIPENCVIVAISGATAGRSAINKIPLTTNQHCCCLEIDPEKALYRYVFHWVSLNYENLKGLGQGARGDLNSGIIKGFEIAIPYARDPQKSLEEQARIVAILDKFDTLTTSIREGLPREIALRQKQYEYYRDLLLTFPKSEEVEA